MSTFNEHESKALRHATNIIFDRFKWWMGVPILMFGLIVGVALARPSQDGSSSSEPRWQPPSPIGEWQPPARPPWHEPETPRWQPPSSSAQKIQKQPTPSLKGVLQSVVHIDNGHGAGSGVAVYSTEGFSFILTAAHVVKNVDFVWVGNVEGVVVCRDERTDLALVRIEVVLPVVEFAEDYARDQDVWSAGFPSDRHVTGTGKLVETGKKIASTAPVYPGMSGGGLFVYQDGMYKFAGTITAVGTCADNCLNLSQSYAVPIATIATFLDRAFSS